MNNIDMEMNRLFVFIKGVVGRKREKWVSYDILFALN